MSVCCGGFQSSTLHAAHSSPRFRPLPHTMWARPLSRHAILSPGLVSAFACGFHDVLNPSGRGAPNWELPMARRSIKIDIEKKGVSVFRWRMCITQREKIMAPEYGARECIETVRQSLIPKETSCRWPLKSILLCTVQFEFSKRPPGSQKKKRVRTMRCNILNTGC
jgi:hypothetical protein